MKKLIVLFLFSTTLFGCGLCSIFSPITNVHMEVLKDEYEIKKANITWGFPQNFNLQLLQIYDKNLNKKFDKEELAVIEKTLLEYIEERGFLTKISYYDKTKEYIHIKPTIYSMRVIDDVMLAFDYSYDLNLPLKKDYKLEFEIKDKEEYFLLKMSYTNVSFQYEMEENSIKYFVDKNAKVKPVEEKKIEEVKEKTSLDKYTEQIKENLLKIEKDKDIAALLFLLLASFVYGMIHALGPGHGKSLAFTYFVNNETTTIKAFIISLAIAFIHIIGALLMVTISFFVIESLLNSFLDDTIYYTTKLSAVLIMLLAGYILYKKFKKKSCGCSSCCSHGNHKKEDLYFVITAGLIPCAGTVLLFIYAFMLKTYISVILASIFISLGMAIVIFASSYLGLSLKKATKNYSKVSFALEVFAPIFMFILGLLLFFNANII